MATHTRRYTKLQYKLYKRLNAMALRSALVSWVTLGLAVEACAWALKLILPATEACFCSQSSNWLHPWQHVPSSQKIQPVAMMSTTVVFWQEVLSLVAHPGIGQKAATLTTCQSLQHSCGIKQPSASGTQIHGSQRCIPLVADSNRSHLAWIRKCRPDEH